MASGFTCCPWSDVERIIPPPTILNKISSTLMPLHARTRRCHRYRHERRNHHRDGHGFPTRDRRGSFRR
ncbi:hypothetical protein CLOP_g15218 [Closterium sp. NIES-67]|nr:hypothetical protein CLOP_g15218 [Closterium sp. NIES-67]